MFNPHTKCEVSTVTCYEDMKVVMARYIVSYRISRYWRHIASYQISI